MKNKYKIGDLVIGNDTLGVVRNHVGVVEYISECYPTRQDQKNDTNKDIVYHVKFGSYGNFLLQSKDFRSLDKTKNITKDEVMKIVNIELLVRAIELLETYQVGSIPLEKLDNQTNKLIKDFEKEYPDLARK